MEPQEALRRVLFLKALPDTALAAIAAAGETWRLGKGEMLFAEHDSCLGLLVVLTGAVKVYKLDNRGRELTLGLEGPGGSVVELPLFDGGNYPAGAEAATDETTLLIVSRERFQQLMAAYPEIAVEVVRALAVRMRKLFSQVEAQTLHTVQARLAGYLLHSAQGRPLFRLEETNEAIASHLGTVREVVSRTLRGFREQGVLTLCGRWVKVEDWIALERTAERTPTLATPPLSPYAAEGLRAKDCAF